MIKPRALIPDSVHTCCTLVPEMLRHLSLLVFLRFLTEIDCFFLPTYQMLTRPRVATQTNAALLVEELAAWTKNNSTALGVIQGKTSPAIWPNFVNHAEAATLWAALETKYGKAGGATTYLQVVSLYKVHMTDSSPLLPQIQAFQENYTRILALRVEKNHCTGHRRRVSMQSTDQCSRIWIANP